MSAETTATKKRASAASPKRTTDDDHRRKRRNRPTQSCLNCHTSKRMCDRQRPCGRCTQLGLTGLCVYEVDNPSHRANAQDEEGRLKKRVAELESIIRELKNKPHPRWAQPGGPSPEDNQDSSSPTDDLGKAESSKCRGSTSSSSPPQSPPATQVPTPPSSASLEPLAHSSSPCAMSSPSPMPQSPIDVYLHPGADITSLLSPDYDLSSFLASYHSSNSSALDDTLFGDTLDPLLPLTPSDSCASYRSDDHCGCLSDHVSYSTVLELSLRLRRATEILSRYAKHSSRSDCKVHKSISDLDRFTTTALGNIPMPPEPSLPQARPPSVPASAVFGRLPYPSARPALGFPSIPPSSHSIQSPRAWDFKQGQTTSYPSPPWEDTFMSWEPLRHQPDWSKGGAQ